MWLEATPGRRVLWAALYRFIAGGWVMVVPYKSFTR